jgi:integrase
MPKRGNNEGSISQRSDGRWVARVTVPGGRRLNLYGKTRAEAAAKLTNALKGLADHTLPTEPSTTVDAFLTAWLRDVASIRLRPRTLRSYEQLARLHILPTIGKLRLNKLTPVHLARLYTQLAQGSAPRSAGHVHRLLHVALSTAVMWGLLGANPADRVDVPRYVRPEIQALTLEQAKALLSAARNDGLEALFVLALTTGMRQAELLGLKWGDVDLAEGTVQVRRSIYRVAGKGWVESEPKTARSRRNLVLAAPAVDALRRHRASQAKIRLATGSEWENRDLVFCNAFGRPLEQSNIRTRSLIPLLKKAGLPPIRFHDLRHSAASLLLAMGVHPKIVQEQLGHSSIAITLDLYSHAMPSLQADAAKRLGDLLDADEA